MKKANLKKEMRLKRQLELERKKRSRRVLVWSLSGGLVVLFVLLAIIWPKPAPLTLEYDKMPLLGSSDAKVKLIEFSDYKCPTCAWFNDEIVSQLKADFIDSGEVSLSFQNWTIIHEDSYTAALAGLAVYHQSNEEFWKFNDALFAAQKPEMKEVWATTDFLVDVAANAGLNIDLDQLRYDIENQTYKEELDRQNAFARKNNFKGTPTLLINGEKYDGALNYAGIKAAIEKALQS